MTERLCCPEQLGTMKEVSWTSRIRYSFQISSPDLKRGGKKKVVKRIWFCFLQSYLGVLSKLKRGDTVGVFVTTKGELHFTINEVDQGIAWNTLPTDRPLYVVINLLHRPTQISALNRSALIMSKQNNMIQYSSMSTHRMLSISFSQKSTIFFSEKMLNRNLEQVNTQKGPVASLLLKF